jgi:hypothetical protein
MEGAFDKRLQLRVCHQFPEVGIVARDVRLVPFCF